ncbi:MAG TPA: isoprenylcysteine carboxylmethyltransferase family protein [Rhizomicrobium sp.]|nr:isoprenylcysteine carboxylmethyltransferase family protein [Rhizomicrobium sp.]
METSRLAATMVVRSAAWMALMGVALLWPAGDWLWPQAWAFLAIFIVGGLGFGAWLIRRDPALLASRLEVFQKGQKAWDMLFLFPFLALWFAWLVVMALDAKVWRYSHVPPWANILGAGLMALGFAATTVVFRHNSFAAPVVRIQAERGQRVIDTGPYAVIRHPMYAAAVPYLAGIPLLLGSWIGLAVVPVFVAGVSVRAIFEERTLARELPGYAEYMRRVRFRLIPGVW